MNPRLLRRVKFHHFCLHMILLLKNSSILVLSILLVKATTHKWWLNNQGEFAILLQVMATTTPIHYRWWPPTLLFKATTLRWWLSNQGVFTLLLQVMATTPIHYRWWPTPISQQPQLLCSDRTSIIMEWVTNGLIRYYGWKGLWENWISQTAWAQKKSDRKWKG